MSKLGISEIALECGFQNTSYFSKQFKQAIGETPQEYKKSARSH
ncbi:MAG: AraC family transcriptional regulator [Clostridiales bacterium]|nr:AraC family transcriptional regulator [Clostridiales bacterium]